MRDILVLVVFLAVAAVGYAVMRYLDRGMNRHTKKRGKGIRQGGKEA